MRIKIKIVQFCVVGPDRQAAHYSCSLSVVPTAQKHVKCKLIFTYFPASMDCGRCVLTIPQQAINTALIIQYIHANDTLR